jgi:uncharacterized HAD superfamily protein
MTPEQKSTASQPAGAAPHANPAPAVGAAATAASQQRDDAQPVMFYRSVADMNQAIIRNLSKIPHDADLVVGIPRSGLLAGSMVSLYLNRPLTDLEGLRERRLIGKGKRKLEGHSADIFDSARRILLVDDCVSRGTELNKARKLIDEWGYADRATFLSVYSFPENPHLADITLEVLPRPMCFQWSFPHSLALSNYCLDIDGVICADAAPQQDDDGPNYLDFLENALPLWVPTTPVGWLVTSRLEKYRPQTEAWMKKHGVEYHNLVMLDLPDQQARIAGGHGVQFKADVYRGCSAELFIESSPGIAKRIAQLSGKPVISMDTGELIGSPYMERREIELAQRARLKQRIRRAPRKLIRMVTGG